MKRKIFALLAAAVFGVMSAGALAACEPTSTNPTEHVCGHVCPETDCGKCTSDCTDPVCADKCAGHNEPMPPTPAEHVCGNVCPEIDCGKCTSDCADPVCADKCAGHEEPTPPAPVPTEYDVIVATSIANGSVSVSAEKAAVGTEITVTAVPADGYKLKSLKYNDIDIVDNKFEMPEENVTVTAEFEPDEENWTAEEIAAVENRNLACGVSVTEGTGGIPSTYEGWIGNLANNGATVTFDVQSDENCEAGLYIKLSKRTASYTFDEAFSVTVNGVHVDCSAAMPKSDSDVWNEFEYVKVGYVSLSSERINNVVITVVSTDGNKICNMYGIKLTSYSANVAAYSEDRDWTEETEFTALDGNAITEGVVSNATVNGNEQCLGQFNLKGKFVSFTTKSTENVRAALWLNISNLNGDTMTLSNAFDVYVNERLVTCNAIMPKGGTQWTEYDYIRFGMVEFEANKPLCITLISKQQDYNIKSFKFVTEEVADITLTTEELHNFDYASEWNGTDVAFVTEEVGNKSITSGVTVSGGVVVDNACAALGGIAGTVGANVSFTVNSTETSRAVIYIDASYRNVYLFDMAFELKVNGVTVHSWSKMPVGSSWTTFEKVALAEIELEQGDSEISITVISDCGDIGCNLAGMTFKTENGALTLKQ